MNLKFQDRKNKINIHTNDIAKTMQEQSTHSIQSDISGSYTGTPVDGDYPTQDADDL